jgi:hypothetical protein
LFAQVLQLGSAHVKTANVLEGNAPERTVTSQVLQGFSVEVQPETNGCQQFGEEF